MIERVGLRLKWSTGNSLDQYHCEGSVNDLRSVVFSTPCQISSDREQLKTAKRQVSRGKKDT